MLGMVKKTLEYLGMFRKIALKTLQKNCLQKNVLVRWFLLQLVSVVFLIVAAWWGWGTSLTLVELGNDGLNNILEFFLLCLEGFGVGLRVGLEPRDLLTDGLLNLLLVRVAQLGAKLVLIGELKSINPWRELKGAWGKPYA